MNRLANVQAPSFCDTTVARRDEPLPSTSTTLNSEPSAPNSDPSALSAEQLRLLADYWRSRGVGEMGAERSFARITNDLRVLGAPATLVDAARQATIDERRHGLWGRDWAVFFGHPDSSDPVAERTRELVFPGARERENSLLRVAFCAFLETVGCHVLDQVRPRISFEPLVRNNRAHLADEVRHARIGWAYLSLLEGDDRNLVARYVPLLLRWLPLVICGGTESDEYDALVPFGYLTPKVLRRATETALREVIYPGLLHLGLSEQSQRGAA